MERGVGTPMARGVGGLLGVGLLVVWIAALSTRQPAWITWLDFVAGVAMVAVVLFAFTAEREVAGVLGIGLFALWLLALARGGAATWLPWWTFVFACAYVAYALLVQ